MQPTITINWSGKLLNIDQVMTGERYHLVLVDGYTGRYTRKYISVVRKTEDAVNFIDVYNGRPATYFMPSGRRNIFGNLPNADQGLCGLFVKVEHADAYVERMEQGIMTTEEKAIFDTMGLHRFTKVGKDKLEPKDKKFPWRVPFGFAPAI